MCVVSCLVTPGAWATRSQAHGHPAAGTTCRRASAAAPTHAPALRAQSQGGPAAAPTHSPGARIGKGAHDGLAATPANQVRWRCGHAGTAFAPRCAGLTCRRRMVLLRARVMKMKPVEAACNPSMRTYSSFAQAAKKVGPVCVHRSRRCPRLRCDTELRRTWACIQRDVCCACFRLRSHRTRPHTETQAKEGSQPAPCTEGARCSVVCSTVSR